MEAFKELQDLKNREEGLRQAEDEARAADEAKKSAETSKTKIQGYYKTLGVTREATMTEIKEAWKKLLKMHHPDKGGDRHKYDAVAERLEPPCQN